MSGENQGRGTALHSLIPLAGFKALLGIDDREDTLSRYCLITSTYTIEQHCKRRLLRRENIDYLTFIGEHIFTLREYPVWKVLTVHVQKIRLHADFLNRSFYSVETPAESKTPPSLAGTVQWGDPLFSPENFVDPKHYYCLPDEGIREDILFSLVLRPLYRFIREKMGIQVQYMAGYSTGKAPADLASACLELAEWNMTRYRRRQIGMTGNARGTARRGNIWKPPCRRTCWGFWNHTAGG
jgi:hypothetical protein